MNRIMRVPLLILAVLLLVGCSTAYKAKPLPFRSPESYANVVEVGGAMVAAQAYADPKEAQDAFGFDIRGAGMLPVQVVFNNRGSHPLKINGAQTFLEDEQGNLWAVLSRDMAYDRATKHASAEDVVKEGAYRGLLGAAAGAIVGAAIGIVGGSNVAAALGKGAAVGAAAGAVIGGAQGYGSGDARREIISDLRDKSLQNVPVEPKTLAHGFLFFPGETPTARLLRLQLVEEDTGKVHVVVLNLESHPELQAR